MTRYRDTRELGTASVLRGLPVASRTNVGAAAGLVLLGASLAMAAPAQAADSGSGVNIRAVYPSKLTLGGRAFVQLEPGGAKRLKGDGSSPPVLTLNGRTMATIVGYDSAVEDQVIFDLRRSAQDQGAWAPLLGMDKPRDLVMRIQGPQETTGRKTVIFDLWAKRGPIAGALIFGVLVLGALLLAAKSTTMLRDAGTATADASGAALGWRDFGTFSLGRVQMAAWFVLVITSYLFVWGVTGDAPPITPSVLALIGIGSGTALGAAIIDDSKMSKAAPLQERHAQVEAEAKAAAASDPRSEKAVDLRNQAAALQQQSEVPLGARRSEGFRDLLTDEHGWSFHRFQLVIWTVVLGGMFIASVYHELLLPDFDSTLLALMGISSGTYLGFKIPEKQA